MFKNGVDFIRLLDGIKNLKIKENEKVCTGIYDGKENRVIFTLIWYENRIFLIMDDDNQNIIKHISKEIGNPDIKFWHIGWIFRSLAYVWLTNREEAQKLFIRLKGEEKENSEYGYKKIIMLLDRRDIALPLEENKPEKPEPANKLLENCATILSNLSGIGKFTTSQKNKTCSGNYTNQRKEKIKFSFSWADDKVVMALNHNDEEIVAHFSVRISKPDIKVENQGWLSKKYIYVWIINKEKMLNTIIMFSKKNNSWRGYKNLQLL